MPCTARAHARAMVVCRGEIVVRSDTTSLFVRSVPQGGALEGGSAGPRPAAPGLRKGGARVAQGLRKGCARAAQGRGTCSPTQPHRHTATPPRPQTSAVLRCWDPAFFRAPPPFASVVLVRKSQIDLTPASSALYKGCHDRAQSGTTHLEFTRSGKVGQLRNGEGGLTVSVLHFRCMPTRVDAG